LVRGVHGASLDRNGDVRYIAVMPVNPETAVRKLVSLPRPMVQAIEDYRFANRVSTESGAIRRLIEAGLRAEAPPAPKAAAPTLEQTGGKSRKKAGAGST
jgi:hypothetical protein